MFTGIVEELGFIAAAKPGGLVVSATTVMSDLEPGGSICVNGVCLTVTSLDRSTFAVDVVPETLRRAALGSLDVGDPVNLERPVAVGGRLDGHIVQGHVDATGTIEAVDAEGDALLVRVAAPSAVLRYVVEKGFIAVDGISLTVVHCGDTAFQFTVIPYTMGKTTLGSRAPGDKVNLEVDILAKYVERLLRPPG